jgi:squalene synthase HpnC
MALLEWESELERCATGDGVNPLFAALGDTIRRRNLSLEPFRLLLNAFHTDLTKTRYRDWTELRDYTRLSADPVGRIVLALGGYDHPDFFALSDKICTALQLANHWQDIAADWRRGRLYVPLEDLGRFGVTEEQIAQGVVNDNFRRLMAFEVDRTRRLFREGSSLIGKLSGLWRFQVALYWHGGMAALERVEAADGDIFRKSLKLKQVTKLRVAFKALKDYLY